MWNPVHYAIYFKQFDALDYFFDDLNVNSRLALLLNDASDEITFIRNDLIYEETKIDSFEGKDFEKLTEPAMKYEVKSPDSPVE